MSFEKKFEKEYEKFYKEQCDNFEKEKNEENSNVADDIIKEYQLDPHLHFDATKLSDKDLELAKKFEENSLTEKEIAQHLDELDKKGLSGGTISYDFGAFLRNKLVEKEGWRIRKERKKTA
ncbi:MAG: hypothetical protein AAB596_02650 [Patescibacteria group bacterium]